MSTNKQFVAGWGNYPMVESIILHPENEKDTKKAIQTACIIPRGLGRSYGDQAINSKGYTAVCTRMNHMIAFDETSGVLECEGGTSLEEIIRVFAPSGWFPMICPGTKFVTIAGAIANDIHGKAHHHDGSFVNSVISFNIMLAGGEVVTASRTENEDLFWGNFGGLGLLGIITSAKIRLRKITTTYFRQRSIVINNLDEMLAALDENDKIYNYSVAWIDPLAKGKKLGSGVLTVGNAATLDDLPAKYKEEPLKIHQTNKLGVPFFLPNFTLNELTASMLNRVIAFVQNSPKEFVHYEKFFFPLDAIHNWNRGYGKRGFIQYQFVIPETGGRDVLILILEKIAASGCSPFLNVFKKMGEGQGILSFPFKGYTLAIDFPVTSKLNAFIAQLDEIILKAGGRIYLGKDAMLHKEVFQAMYPQYQEWLQIKSKYDPSNVFTSDISRRLGLYN